MARAGETSASSKSLMVIAFVLAITGLYFGRSVFIPLALALVLSFLLSPFLVLLEKIHFGRVPSALLVVVFSLALVGVATWGVAGQMVEIMADLPDYKANLDEKIKSLHGSQTSSFSKATASVQELNRELSTVPGQVSDRAKDGTRATRPIAVQVAPPASNMVQDLSELLGPLSGPLETAVIVIIFTLFMLVKREDLRNRAIRLAGRGQLSVMTQAFDDASHRLSRYLLLQFLVNAGYGSLFGVGLYFIGVPHALLWGIVAAFLRFVPYIGTFAGAALPIAMAMAVFPGWRQAGLVFGTFVALELAVSNAVEPLLYGAQTGISSLAILVAAVFWATLWGPVGLILSTPLTVCLVVLGRYVPQLKFLEVVLGDEPALPPEQLFYQRLLAMDPEEARSIAEAYIKEARLKDDKRNQIESFYDSIVIPALRLAEQDYHIDALDDETRKFVLLSTREVIEDVGDRLLEDSIHSKSGETGKHASNGNNDSRLASTSGVKVICVPVRGGSDELVATMLTQLLRSAGYRAFEVRAGAVEEMLAEVVHHDANLICVSCLPPFPSASARALCKRLKAKFPNVRVILGLWDLEGDINTARERMGPGCPDVVTTNLAEVIAEIQRFSGPETGAEARVEADERFCEPLPEAATSLTEEERV